MVILSHTDEAQFQTFELGLEIGNFSYYAVVCNNPYPYEIPTFTAQSTVYNQMMILGKSTLF